MDQSKTRSIGSILVNLFSDKSYGEYLESKRLFDAIRKHDEHVAKEMAAAEAKGVAYAGPGFSAEIYGEHIERKMLEKDFSLR